MTEKTEVATLGGGCFWCVEAVYQELRGVKKVVSGYAGGEMENPSYQQICSGTTGHAEVVQITFDPEVLTYSDLLEVFWQSHDPTTLNRQGSDVGPQYRSIILYHSEAQRRIAEKSKEKANASGEFQNPIVSEIAPLTSFYEAESYHQDYYRSNPYQPYCMMVISPKVRKFRKNFQARLAN